MSDFDALLANYTSKETPKVHGVICKCVDRHGICPTPHLAKRDLRLTLLGNEIYSKVAGYDSVLPGASPLREDVVLKVASATKLITSIALLQCIDKGLIDLDEPVTKVLPEFDQKQILTDVSGSDLVLEPSKTPITARHLLTHTSGLGYPFTHRLLRLRAEVRNRAGVSPSLRVTERYEMPLVFEPGTGWLYGCSLDWAGVIVSRLHGGISLEQYFVENIWQRLGLSEPFPCFNIARHPEYNARVMGGAIQTPEGRLQPKDHWAFDNPEDQDGGSGLSCTTKDYVAVLADLVSDSPKLLKPATIAEMFTPQLEAKSPGVQMLLGLRPAWDTVSGPIAENAINHGLGGVLCMDDVPEIDQPKGMLGWGGASNIVWWVNRELRVAGFFATQQAPFGNPSVTRLVNAWKKDFWAQFKTIDHA
uniref:Acyltransferase calJ n=1 Tax=Penicillium decumbens TaxID=69771 RepID=CALJ_PENDC|nr:RecName: Full=Acyltransferase calJ; AltName: Full=Calbistrin biosynthesis cluster protein J [Penicillium decumbens]